MFYENNLRGTTKPTFAASSIPRIITDQITELLLTLEYDEEFYNKEWVIRSRTAETINKLDPRLRPGKAFCNTYKKDYKVTIPPAIKTKIGNILGVVPDQEMSLLLTLGCEGYSEDYYHRDSCWWGDFERSRDVLEHNGGGAIRAYDSNGELVGRVWFIPYKEWIVVFNSYGDRLLQHTSTWGGLIEQAFGWTVTEHPCVEFGCGSEDLYVNSGKSLIVGPTKFVGDTDYLTLEIDTDAPYTYSYRKEECLICGNYHHEDSMYYVYSLLVDEGYYCEYCFYERLTALSAGAYEGEIAYRDDAVLCNGEYYYHTEIVTDSFGNEYYSEDGVEINGEWYAPESVELVED